MANYQDATTIKEKIQQALEELGAALDRWVNQYRPQAQPIPVPIDRPMRKK
jgi:hypothetical protein